MFVAMVIGGYSNKYSLHFFHCLFYVGNDVFNILNAYRQADEVGSNARFEQLLVGKLAVSVACRVEYASAGIGNMGHDADEVKVVHELYSFFACSLQSESYYTA